MGLLCRHILKVMISLDISEIPSAHILKRWTREARDVLPAHLVNYEMGSAAFSSQTFRHSALYIVVLELVQMGDCNVKTYEYAFEVIVVAKKVIAQMDQSRDGLSFEEQAAQMVVAKRKDDTVPRIEIHLNKEVSEVGTIHGADDDACSS